MSRARVILADDHQLFAEGLKALLAEDYDVVAIVGDGDALLDAVERDTPDLVVTDVSMPGLNGVECLRKLRERSPELRVVLLTMHEEAPLAVLALRAGAAGFLLKHACTDEVLEAVSRAMNGETFVSPSLAAEVERLMAEPSQAKRGLTPRQREIVGLLAQGLLAKEVAQRLGLSRRTVEFHKYQAMERLGVDSSAELLAYALKNGLGPI